MRWPWQSQYDEALLLGELDSLRHQVANAELNRKALYDRAWLFFKGLRENRLKYPKDKDFYDFALEQFTWVFGWSDTDEFVEEVEKAKT